MIGSGLKKLANENGMKVAHGVAYGNFRGFALTMCEGSGWKRLDFTTRFLDPAAQNAFQAKLTEVDLKKTYRVQALNMQHCGGVPRYRWYHEENPRVPGLVYAFAGGMRCRQG